MADGPVVQYTATILGTDRSGSNNGLPQVLSIFADRVECRKPGMIKHGTTDVIRYPQVAQVLIHRGVFWSGLSVETNGGGGFRIDGLKKKDAEAAKTEIDRRVSAAYGQQQESRTDIVAQLEKLTSLHQAGRLTDAEFASAKQQLLGS